MKEKIMYTIYTFILLLLVGCSDFLEPKMKGSTELDLLITTEEGMLTAVNGMYQPLQAVYKGIMPRLTDLASDDGWAWRNDIETDLYIVEQDYSSTSTAWRQYYLIIGRANVILDNLENVDYFKEEQQRQYFEGQAKFMRGLSYFFLVRFFGGVPLMEHSVVFLEDAQVPRATIPEVYAQIEKDLNEAELLLPASYSGNTGYEKGRPTTYSASALKALVYLEIEEWNKAVESAAKVIGNGTLIPYADNFNGSAENGSQSLFEVQYGGPTSDGTTNISTTYSPTFMPSGSAGILPTDDMFEGKGGGPSSGNGFVQLFDDRPEDNRKEVILDTYGLPNFIDASKPDGSLWYVNKYYNAGETPGRSSWNFPLIRYAEILLVKAEALNELGYVPNGEAFDLVNQIRRQAGLDEITSTQLPDQNSFREYIMTERRIELAFECKRYFDLNRTGKLESAIQQQLDYLGLKFPVSKMITHPITGKSYYLYPVPSTEFVNNALLGEQNPGYK